jgi:hypothetical protein
MNQRTNHARPPCNPKHLDPGIRDAVLLLRNAEFRTFTSCKGGKGHSFQHETIGLELEGLICPR